MQSILALCRTFLKAKLNHPLIYPAYHMIRRYLAKNRLFIRHKRSLLKKNGYLPPRTSANTGDLIKAGADKRPNMAFLLQAGGEPAVPLTIGFIITEDNPETIYGDYFTAHGLGDALEEYGFHTVYLPERPVFKWHHLASVDILVVLRHDFDPILLQNRPGTTGVAWIRGYVDEWCRAPWFSDYDMVLATSNRALSYAKRFTDSKKCMGVLGLAADTDLFKPGPCLPDYASDICFVGNLFEVPREFTRKLTIKSGTTFNLYGLMTDKKHAFKKYHCGKAAHRQIPDIYNSSKIVLEDCTPMCRPWGCVNSRTFEAMACGACVISNEVPGLKTLFGGSIITYGESEDLNRIIAQMLADNTRRERIGALAREKILQRHTYRHRAKEFRQALFQYFEIAPPETG